MVDAKKSEKEVLVVQDQGFFKHETGDTYDGFFELKKKDRSAKMMGPGTYTTAEGDVYVGIWDADRLGVNKEEVSITFKDTCKYEGPLKDWSYSGPGQYHYPDGSVLHCQFVDNCPKDHMTFVDPNGHKWLGIAENGFGWCAPVNHYFEMLEKTQEAGKAQRRRKLRGSS